MRAIVILVVHELRHAWHSVRFWLFAVPYALFWVLALRVLGDGAGQWLATDDGVLAATWLLSPEVSAALFAERPATLSVTFLLMMLTAPAFAIAAAFDQTSSDQGSRYLRFLATRVGRAEIFVARALAAWLVLLGALLAVLVPATVIAVAADGSQLLPAGIYAARIALTVALYTAAFVAMTGVISASVASGALSALIAMALYALLAALIAFVTLRWPALAVVDFVLPSGFRPVLVAGGPAAVAGALAAVVGYTLAFGALGMAVFRRRDL